jgi:predicted O-linked N-acetylglucosamine transferase (SPINDLY family)
MPSEFWNRTMWDLQMGRFEQALASVRMQRRLKPQDGETAWLLGTLLQQMGDQEQAAPHLRAAAQFLTDNLHVHRALAEACMMSGRHPEGLEALRRATEIAPTVGDAWLERTAALLMVGDVRRAETVAAEGLLHLPGWPPLTSNRVVALARAGRYDDAIEASRECLRLHPDTFDLRSNVLLMLHYAERPCEEVLDEHRAFGAALPAPAPPVRRTDASGGLRIGVLSCDLRGHAVGSFVEPLLQHAPAGTHLVAFSNQPHGHDDPVRLRLKRHFHAWHEVHMLDDAALDGLIRQERIDVLIELGGHTGNNRLPAIARKPAPLIVTAIGYPDTTGVPAIDLRLVDSVTDPAGSEAWCTERLLRVDPCFLCYTPPADAPEPGMPPDDAPFTFGSFNNAAKVGPSSAAVWSRALDAVPGSRLLLKAHWLADAGVGEAVRGHLRGAGIDLARVELLGETPDVPSHLALYQRVHVALDTTPYNGTTTTCEALWMGVPVLTVPGDRHSARVSASLLNTAGLREFIAPDADSLARAAAALAADRVRLVNFRSGLRDCLRRSALLDARAYGARVHAAIRQAFERVT